MAKNSIACYLDSVVQRHLVQMMASVLENQTRSIMYKNTNSIVGMKASAASLEMMAAENSTLVHLCSTRVWNAATRWLRPGSDME